MCDGKHEKAMSGGDTTGDNNDDFFACFGQLNTAFVIQHGIVDSLNHCCCISTLRIAVPMEQGHDLITVAKTQNTIWCYKFHAHSTYLQVRVEKVKVGSKNQSPT